MPSDRSILAFALTLFLAIFVGCQNNDLKIHDHDRFTPGGRASYEIWPGIEERRSGTLLDLVAPSVEADARESVTVQSAGVRPTIAIEGEMAAVEGRDHQRIEAGEQVELDVVIPGPARLKLNAENLRGHVAARGGVRFFDVVSLEAILGVGIDNTEVRLRGGGVDTTDEDLRAGFLFGGRATIRPIPLFDLYYQSVANWVDASTLILDRQVGVELNLTKNLSAFAGYRWWRYSESFSSGSDWRIDIRGPTAGASLKF